MEERVLISSVLQKGKLSDEDTSTKALNVSLRQF